MRNKESSGEGHDRRELTEFGGALTARLRRRDYFLLRAWVQFLRTVLRLGDGDASLGAIRL